MSKQPGPAPHPGIPREQIAESMKSYSDCMVRITRRGEFGRIASITSRQRMPVPELLTLDDYCTDKAGGGTYRIEATDPSNPATLVVPVFEFTVEGPPKPFGAPAEPPRGGYYAPGGPRYGVPREQRVGLHPRDLSTHNADDVALEMGERMNTLRLEERQEREAEKRAALERQERLERENAELRKSMQKVQDDAKEARFEARIAEIKAAAGTKSSLDWNAVAAFGASVLVPIVTTLIQSGQSRHAHLAETQHKSTEQHTALLTAVLGKPSGGLDLPAIISALTALGPMIKPWIENKSPAAQAKLISAAGEQILAQTSMAAQLIQQMQDSQGEDSPWVRLAKSALEAGETIAGALLDRQTQAIAPIEARAEVVSRAPRQVVGMPTASVAPPPIPAPRAMAPAPARGESPEQKMQRIMQAAPPHLQSQDWATIVYHLGVEAQASVEDIAEAVTKLLFSLDDHHALPEAFGDVLSDDGHDVAVGMTNGFFQYVIPAVSETYCQQVVSAVARHIAKQLATEDAPEDAPAEPEPVIVTPAPPPTPAPARPQRQPRQRARAKPANGAADPATAPAAATSVIDVPAEPH